MRETLTDRFHFLRAFVANPRQVGAILPTSRWAVRDMLDLADVPRAELVVELGAGTGVQTGEILARLGPNARLVALEIDPDLAKLLDERYDDPRTSTRTWAASGPTCWSPRCRTPRSTPGCAAGCWTCCRSRWHPRGCCW